MTVVVVVELRGGALDGQVRFFRKRKDQELPRSLGIRDSGTGKFHMYDLQDDGHSVTGKAVSEMDQKHFDRYAEVARQKGVKLTRQGGGTISLVVNDVGSKLQDTMQVLVGLGGLIAPPDPTDAGIQVTDSDPSMQVSGAEQGGEGGGEGADVRGLSQGSGGEGYTVGGELGAGEGEGGVVETPSSDGDGQAVDGSDSEVPPGQ